MIGQTIAGYEVLEVLGEGGMGVVYKARHTRLRRLVALKLLPPEQVADESRGRRFLQEARAASALNHPGIVTIHDVVTEGGADILVMELVEGESLAQRIPSDGLPWRQAAELALELAEAMAVAHDAGIVHRDLKPANVMVMTASGRIKVLDFGIAKLMPDPGRPDQGRPEATLSQLTELGARPGTPSYMAPEQLLAEPIDKRADIFAFGILVYEMLTGQRPFRGHNPVALADQILHSDPQPVRESRPEIPAPLAALVDKALAKQPARRHQSMDEIGVLLRSILSPSPRAEPGGTTEGMTLKALVACDLVESTLLSEETVFSEDTVLSEETVLSGEQGGLLHDLMEKYRGREIDGGRLLLFELPWDAVRFALAFHRILAEQERTAGTESETRVGIHLGEVTVGHQGAGDQGDWTFDVEEQARATAANLLSLAGPGQTLLTHAAFDLARRGAVRRDQDSGIEALAWLAHGDYLFPGTVFSGTVFPGTVFPGTEAVEIFEVGAEGFAPLSPPVASGEVTRAPSQSKILGWHPAPGLTVPQRPNWVVERKLGEGGFGEVWLAAQAKTHERRVFKFCYEAQRLRSLQREITVFRLLKEELGERDDIARLIDWNLDQAPYFIESAYTEGGSLMDWSAARGGIAAVDLGQRLELIAQVATALEAAHSVGVLHKDVKPANVLVTASHSGPEGHPRAMLSDFGIGLITDSDRLKAQGITVLGLTEETNGDSSKASGTRLYMAPELQTDGTPTIQSDIYALGVMLYQVVVGDLGRPLAPGWERDVGDELLREDIAAFADGRPQHRPRSALEVAERLRTLEERRQQRQSEEEVRRARARGRRLRRLAAWLGVAATVMLLVISAFAYQTLRAKNHELEARQNAEQRRRQAEKLIDFLLGDLRLDLQPIGKLDILDKVGDQAMEYFAAVPKGDLSNEEMRNYAKALHQIGQVRLGLGRVPEAAEAFGRSLALAEGLAARDRARADWQFELGQSHFWLGFLHFEDLDLEAALEQFEAYRRISRDLVARDPENADWQLELAYSHSNIASVLEQRGDLSQAATELEDSVRTLERLSADKGDAHPLQVELAHVYVKLGKVLENQGDLVGASARYQANLDLMRRASEAAGDNMELLRFLGFAHSYVGEILRLSGDLTEATRHYRAGLDIAARIASHDTENLIWREELAQLHNQLGRALLAAKDFGGARSHFERDAALTRVLVELYPDHRLWRLARARSRWGSALLWFREGRSEAARRELEICLEALEALEREAPRKRQSLWLARTGWLLGEARETLGDTEGARSSREAAVVVAERLVEQDRTPFHLDILVRLLVALDRRGEARPLIAELTGIGYREASYLAFLRQPSA